jgi:4-carboxymuconolactone decarboxylase
MAAQQQATPNPPTFGRYAEIPPEQFSPKQKEAYDYILRERGMCPGPYRIWLQNPELLKAMTPIGVYYQKKLQISRQEHEIVTNCINGKWPTAGYSNEEHEEIAEKAGLPPEKVQALIAGLPTSFEDLRQQVIYEITQTLIAARRVPQGLYQRAVDLLGDAGLTEVTVLIGYFTSVSMTLAVYDVPSRAPDCSPYKYTARDAMTEPVLTPRLPLVDNISHTFDKLPPINLFRAAANARTLYPAFIQYMYLLFKPLELDGRIERLVVLYVGKLSDCIYIWRQNVVVAKSLGITQKEIDTLDGNDTTADCFSDAQKAAFRFTQEALELIEVSDEVYANASGFFSAQALAELLYVIGTYMLLARVARTGRVPLDETPAAAILNVATGTLDAA